MASLSERLIGHVRRADVFPRPGLALLAVSGGSDSIALLDLFAAVARDLALTLAVAHVDHGIAENSAAVGAEVMALAARYGFPAHLRRLDLGPGAAGSETRARSARYSALREMQAECGASYLVTAHHADDLMETVLFRFLRGSGPAGLAGIAPRGPGGLIRPLLPFRRNELDEWLESRFSGAATRPAIFRDPANQDERHDRSWLRQRVLPLLRERFGEALDKNLLAGQQHAVRDRQAWSHLLRSLPDLDFRRDSQGVDVARAPLRTYDKTLSEALLRAAAREVGCTLGRVRAKKVLEMAVRAHSGRMAELGDGWLAELVFDRLRIHRSSVTVPPPVSWGDTERGSVRWGSWDFAWRIEPAGSLTREGAATWAPKGSGTIRAAGVGDRMLPVGGPGRRSVSRLLMEARVPRSERSSHPVVLLGGELLWVPTVCRAGRTIPVPGEPSFRIDARRV